MAIGVLFDSGGGDLAVVTFTNVKTGKKVGREELKEEEFIYEGKPLLLEMDMDAIITYANRRFIDISGYSKEELIGLPYSTQIHPSTPQAIFPRAKARAIEGKIWNGYICHVSKEGVGYWTEVTMQLKNSGSGTPLGLMLTMHAPNPKELEQVIEEFEEIIANGNNPNAKSKYCGVLF